SCLDSGHPRYLHSFPTRRSSDLDQLRARFNADAVSGRIEAGYRQATSWLGLTPYAALQATMFSLPNYSEFAVVGNNAFALNYARSEEHTSELQSLAYLVCRLLLE